MEIYLSLHELVLAAVPDVKFSVDEVDASIGYGTHQYGYNGWGMAALTPHGKWISLTLLQGSRLDDPSGLLTGTAVMRHVKLSKPDELSKHRGDIETLVRSASTLKTA